MNACADNLAKHGAGNDAVCHSFADPPVRIINFLLANINMIFFQDNFLFFFFSFFHL